MPATSLPSLSVLENPPPSAVAHDVSSLLNYLSHSLLCCLSAFLGASINAAGALGGPWVHAPEPSAVCGQLLPSTLPSVAIMPMRLAALHDRLKRCLAATRITGLRVATAIGYRPRVHLAVSLPGGPALPNRAVSAATRAGSSRCWARVN